MVVGHHQQRNSAKFACFFFNEIRQLNGAGAMHHQSGAFGAALGCARAPACGGLAACDGEGEGGEQRTCMEFEWMCSAADGRERMPKEYMSQTIAILYISIRLKPTTYFLHHRHPNQHINTNLIY